LDKKHSVLLFQLKFNQFYYFSLPVVFDVDEVEFRASLIVGDCKRFGDGT
jgi:hypothetical protein